MFDAKERYFQLSEDRAGGYSQNSDLSSPEHNQWVTFVQGVLSGVSGIVLDIGCESRESRKMWPLVAFWTGLDPAPKDKGVLKGFAEDLPFVSGSLDTVAFLGSLDHILDYRTAFDEAVRVTRPGGLVVVAGLEWKAGSKAALYNDHVHWHHFRRADYLALANTHNLTPVQTYYEGWKGEAHRRCAGYVWRKPSC
jgi:SAM-dependent methyltransferase